MVRPWPRFVRFVFGLAAAIVSIGAQVPPPAGPGPEWVGTWSGSARLTNEGGAAPCVYEGPASPPSVTLEITKGAEALKGTITLTIPVPNGSPCPALERTAELRDLVPTGSSLTFSGPGKHTWTLGRKANELVGLVAWKGAGDDEGGSGLRLAGEVRLKRTNRHKGSTIAAVGGIAVANVVGIGAFALANKAGKSNSTGTPQINCSPRRCVLTSVTEPCICNTTLTSGSTCGTTASGVAYLGACNVDGGLPCQASLSCNSGFCEDRFGHCPF